MKIRSTRTADALEGGFIGMKSNGKWGTLPKNSAKYAKIGSFIVSERRIVSIWPPIYEKHFNRGVEQSFIGNIRT